MNITKKKNDHIKIATDKLPVKAVPHVRVLRIGNLMGLSSIMY